VKAKVIYAARVENARKLALAGAELISRAAKDLSADSEEHLARACQLAEEVGVVKYLASEIWLRQQLKAWANGGAHGPAPVIESDPLRIEAEKAVDSVIGLLSAVHPVPGSPSKAGRSIRRSSRKR
jgi:hypothetical protein